MVSSLTILYIWLTEMMYIHTLAVAQKRLIIITSAVSQSCVSNKPRNRRSSGSKLSILARKRCKKETEYPLHLGFTSDKCITQSCQQVVAY